VGAEVLNQGQPPGLAARRIAQRVEVQRFSAAFGITPGTPILEILGINKNQSGAEPPHLQNLAEMWTVLCMGDGYLRSRGYQVMKDWTAASEVVPASQINWTYVAIVVGLALVVAVAALLFRLI